jgi:hypothetical protein
VDPLYQTSACTGLQRRSQPYYRTTRSRRRRSAEPELPFRGGLRGIVTRGLEQPVGKRQFMDRSQRQEILVHKRTAGVRQIGLVAERPNPHGDLRIPVARQVGKQVVLDLVAQISSRKRQQRTSFEVCRTQHLPQIPLRPGFILQYVSSEFICAIREMPAEDHHVRPQIPQQVGRHVRGQRPAPARPAQRRKEHVVLDGLAPIFRISAALASAPSAASTSRSRSE